MAGNFRDICDAFNKAAQDLPRGGKTSEVMLTRYALLLKHKAETDEEKSQLVGTLYKCGVDMLKDFTGASANTWIGDVVPGNIKTVFEALRVPESLKHIPEKAPRELADIALDLLAQAEGITQDQISSPNRRETHRTQLITFARTALETADACRAAIDERTIDISTSKNITAVKRIVLKKDPTEGPQ